MITAFVFLIFFTGETLGSPVPTYGVDGGYQGYARYDPLKGLRGSASQTQATYLRGHSEAADLDTNVYETGARHSLSASQPPKSSKASSDAPVVDDALKRGPQRPYSGIATNTIVHISPRSQGAQYGHIQGGYKISDVAPLGNHNDYNNDYGNEYPHHPQPYQYGYSTKDEHGNEQHKKETSDGHGNVQGSYGYQDEHGLYRHVDYVADKQGFRASVKTNEPGTENQNPADVHMDVQKGHKQY